MKTYEHIKKTQLQNNIKLLRNTYKMTCSDVSHMENNIRRPTLQSWELDKATLECFLKKHPKSKIYMEDKFGHVDETTKEELMETTFGKTFTTMGIGSCASTIEESVKLYKDKRNNLKISRFCMKWD